MKPFLYRSSAILLTTSLLLPVASAHANTIAANKAVSVSAQGNLAALAASKDAKLSKDAALAIANRIVPSQGLELKSVSFRSPDSWRNFPEWSFSWEKKVPDKNEVQTYYSVSIHANTGELTSYSYHDQENANLPYAKRISYDEARKQAESFLATSNAGKAAQTKLYLRSAPTPKTPLYANSTYSFSFARVVDGIWFIENSAEVSVNSAGKVVGYSLMWNDDIQFHKPSSPISEDEAKELLKEETKPSLAYVIPWEAQGEMREKPVLAYTNPFQFVIDAKDGTALNQLLAPRSEASDPEPVSAKSLSARHKGKALSQEEAIRMASQTFNLSGYELRSAQYSESEYRGNRPVWDLSYEKKGSQDYDYAHVSIDAATGDIYSYSKRPNKPLAKDGTTRKLDTDALKEQAMDSIRKWTPTTAHEFYWNEHSAANVRPGDSSEQTLVFQRYVGDVLAASGSASVTFDAQTGEIVSYHAEIGKEKYPSQPPKHLSADKAADAWWDEAEIEAVYVMEQLSPEDQKKIQTQPSYIPKREAKLVYRASATLFDEPYFFDAVSGDWRSQSTGKTVALHRAAPSDLEGHPAAKELLLMYEYDALSLIDGKIVPEKTITRGEMIEMLMISINQGRFFPVYSAERKASFSDVSNQSRYFAAVESAVDRGLLDKQSSKLNPDEAITREELADMIVRALGYHNLAQYSEMFQSDLSDIANSKKRGSIVIATTMGIIPTDKQKFQPAASVSRADAAISFSRFLEKRSEQDTKPILYR